MATVPGHSMSRDSELPAPASAKRYVALALHGIHHPAGPFVIGERVGEENWSENQWIPAFAGMTEEGVPAGAVRTLIPAFAG